MSNANCIKVWGGKVAAICQFCGIASESCAPDLYGHPNLLWIGSGWSEAPYPHHFHHKDGSIGSMFTCPACNVRLHAGEPLRSRGYVVRNIA